MSFRSLVFAGFVLLLTAFYQSTQPSALTVTTGLTPWQRVKRAHVPFELDAASGRYVSGLPHATSTPPVHGRFVGSGVLLPRLPRVYLLATTGETQAVLPPRASPAGPTRSTSPDVSTLTRPTISAGCLTSMRQATTSARQSTTHRTTSFARPRRLPLPRRRPRRLRGRRHPRGQLVSISTPFAAHSTSRRASCSPISSPLCEL